MRRVLVAGALVGAMALGPPAVVLATTAAHRHGTVTDVPEAPVAIVLGAGLDASGRPTTFLARRLDVAVELYRSGRVRALLMSGDHSTVDHDEVEAMTAYARDRGVPAEAMAADHAGFDTYSSCYRARSVWGIDRAVVITQAFHLPRAVWLCRRLGLEVEGAVAGDAGYTATSGYGWVREVPANDKAVLDVVRGRVPTFPGPREHALDPFTGAS